MTMLTVTLVALTVCQLYQGIRVLLVEPGRALYTAVVRTVLTGSVYWCRCYIDRSASSISQDPRHLRYRQLWPVRWFKLLRPMAMR